MGLLNFFWWADWDGWLGGDMKTGNLRHTKGKGRIGTLLFFSFWLLLLLLLSSLDYFLLLLLFSLIISCVVFFYHLPLSLLPCLVGKWIRYPVSSPRINISSARFSFYLSGFCLRWLLVLAFWESDLRGVGCNSGTTMMGCARALFLFWCYALMN